MATPKNPGRAVSIRVAQGSALERMTSDRPFTAAVHQMAELLEKVFAEGWGPPCDPFEAIQAMAKKGSTWDGDYERLYNQLIGMTLAPVVAGVRGTETGRTDGRQPNQSNPPAPERVFQLVEPDGRSTRTVSQSEVLRLAAEQYPAGLVPVGLDEGDDAPADLSHLA